MIGASAVPDLVEIGYEITRPKGKYVQGGIPPPGYEKEFGVAERSIGAVEGLANPWQYLFETIGWYRDKRFPDEKW
ncbi:hypothetical protein CLAFUW4_08157 [Fulvia fulva]|uniref:Uncharacterized protein n=1 Tax=Passalora fulva TaxID=5499 RepID=A0A9Q8P6G2_PASFU|nr:uncharacterized protein CLAFUR5_08271 [Fulvia fulva]KAK4629189.1 hypothetical protein CLAFUR4_08162 [Fulvia fulva]KAK4630240.1 hypothetical protein CLAFUR0_08157 [Fulvia fulva]UJO14969.1 hypothetical protein CLAFUR5_08271 [Fulvia fulva]WPV12638.1 hypothetical protein CLAFUW4_08157 [Fulvia fulva]WPV27385.1 hypothetical protein CLAFUW7_08157 [Fulvia fulva]